MVQPGKEREGRREGKIEGVTERKKRENGNQREGEKKERVMEVGARDGQRAKGKGKVGQMQVALRSAAKASSSSTPIPLSPSMALSSNDSRTSGSSSRERQRQRDIEEIRSAADAYYKNGNTQTIEMAETFFKKMDCNQDGSVSEAEFMHCLSKTEYPRISKMANPSFFKTLDRDKDDKLDFNDVCTFLYIIVTERQFCNRCGDFLMGLFFTCVTCYDQCNDDTFNLCSKCFSRGNPTGYIHEHKNIIDNYSLHTLRRGRSSSSTVQPHNWELQVGRLRPHQPAMWENLPAMFNAFCKFIGLVVGPLAKAAVAAGGCSIM